MSAQIKFAETVEQSVDYFRREFDLTYFEAIGVLTHIAHNLSAEVNDQAEENYENYEEEED